ncbi:MAG: pyrroloquinoline quinone biosynthesis protein PqqE [Armatimonadetes bacterium]|nr:pyrroloquinoline quinone biosynthesis protein PqqE [Armatimonadota bacterium]MDE2206612.1 pyrroloquinoline quinone biosynthesis protein PqqE [Armatimonadota bacterium]
MTPAEAPRPLGLLAELTWRCPLHCPYCSNPAHYPAPEPELSTEDWRRVMAEAAELGVLHALISGGEPLLRADLELIVKAARSAGLYTNLITSGIGLSQARLTALSTAGLESVQISLQAAEAGMANEIAGARAHTAKLEAARRVTGAGLPLTINTVIHRLNIEQVGAIIALAEALGARRLELASAQFYGWALLNRDALLASRRQVESMMACINTERDRLGSRMQLLVVTPDYYAGRPKPCMNGWGARYLTVNPYGRVLPCPTAGHIAGMEFESVRVASLRRIWTDSEAFNRYRGTAWMPAPCSDCAMREIDFGGCRCQAAALTGDAAGADPVCELAPDHGLVLAAAAAAESGESRPAWQYRRNPTGRFAG